MANQQDSSAAAEVLRTLFKRCVECPSTQPACPTTCKSDETCSLIPQSCDTCSYTTCVKIGVLPGQAIEKKATPVGAIIGGVLGAVAFIILTICLSWFLCVKPRRRRRNQVLAQAEKRNQSGLARDGSRTHSIASTVLTRASNVIQIAYIPGITGRSPPESPNMIPPMPELANRLTTTTNGGTPQFEQHYFMPGDLRNSTWSDTSSIDPRISLAPSLANRASVATTIYRSDAVVPPIPAQHAFRAQANVVSVKPGSVTGNSTPGSQTPPIPQASRSINIQNSSIVARNVVARPIEVKKIGSGNRVPTLGNLARQNSKQTIESSRSGMSQVAYSEEKEVVSRPGTFTEESPPPSALSPASPYHGTHGDRASELSAVLPSQGSLAVPRSVAQRPDSGGLTAMIEDAIKSASSPRPEVHRYDSGPFSDSNAL